MVKPILLLGSSDLYDISRPVTETENIKSLIEDLHDTLQDWRQKNNAGRAIAAPQIGIKKRVIYMNIDEPIIFINPRLEFPTPKMMEIWDDCMSLPGLYVKVRRYEQCNIHFTDIEGNKKNFYLQGSLSELIQHEYDHLEGVLATMRAIDSKSFRMPRD
ncbi:peptide deformylase [Pectinatus haikarae]|uniref:Peptide deformylase n=1 Tax=Pectinatus haikarae TaxID=349096 RepID=A0ABT9Y4Y5_9FIRM|nr:peptide deformylase [Pectinatus haikarae]MDQ0202894.1 peptide deformylase [Pectinatus haikarae]